MKKEELLIKRESTVIYKGLPFKVAGFREGTQNAILNAWVDAPLSDLEPVSGSKYVEGKGAETVNTSDDFLYMKIHKQISEELKSKSNITEEQLETIIKDALI